MPRQLRSFHVTGELTGRDGLSLFRKLLICLVLPCLLGGCAKMLADGMVFKYTVMYTARSPEFVLRDMGSNHYLLGQWFDYRLQVRYYDRSTDMVSTLPEAITVYRKSNENDKIIGAVRYESDSPLQIAFFGTRETHYDEYCGEETNTKVVLDTSARQRCGTMHIVLSLDGGRSFADRRIRTSMGPGHMSPNKFEFAIVRGNTVYFGLYYEYPYAREPCCRSPYWHTRDDKGAVYLRRFEGKAVADRNDVFLSVLAMPLPDNGGKPMPAEQIPQQLWADVLTDQALLDVDLGQPMARLETPPFAGPKPSFPHYRRAQRQAYIESLRAEYPEWAAHQTLDDITEREQLLTLEEIRALSVKSKPHRDDPVEWIRYDWPIIK